MGRILKKYLSVLLICSLVLTTNATFTFANGLNTETTEAAVETSKAVESSEAVESNEVVETSETVETAETVEASETVETSESVEKSFVGPSTDEEESEETSEYVEEPEEETTVEKTTAEETTAEETSAEETSAEETSAEETTAEETSAEETTAEETSAEETSAEETTAEVTSAEETTTEESTTEESTIEEATTVETTTKETIVEEATLSEASVGENADEKLFSNNSNELIFTFPDEFKGKALFDSGEGSSVIIYDDPPATKPSCVYIIDKNLKYVNRGWDFKTNTMTDPVWKSDNELDQFISEWNDNMHNVSAEIKPHFFLVKSASIVHAPNKVQYNYGEEIDPKGLILSVSGDTESRDDIAYDKAELKHLFAIEQYDSNGNKINGNKITALTHHIRYSIFGVYCDVNITVNPALIFICPDTYSTCFNYKNGPTRIDYKPTDTIKIPIVHMNDVTEQINIGWYKDEVARENWINDTILERTINEWKNNPSHVLLIFVSLDWVKNVYWQAGPTTRTYKVGEQFDPSGLVLNVVSQSKVEVDISYDNPGYKDMIQYELCDKNDKKIEGNIITADTDHVKFRVFKYKTVDVQLYEKGNYKFTFKIDSKHRNYARFNSVDGPTEIVYYADDLKTKPITIPTVYLRNILPPEGVIMKRDWGKGEPYYTPKIDSELLDYINLWTQVPSEDVEFYADFYRKDVSKINTKPTKLTYNVGDKIDPTGLILDISYSQRPWEVENVAYDSPLYKHLFSYALLDENKNIVNKSIVTKDTKYCRFYFNFGLYNDVEIDVIPPKTFTFVNNDGYFDGIASKQRIEYYSYNASNITIPVPYLTSSGKFDYGWTDGTVDMLDVALQQKINAWKANPEENVVITVNTYDQADVGSNVDASAGPTKTRYYEGRKFAPAGLEFEAYDDGHVRTKTIKYNEPQYARLFTDVTYLDSSKHPITTDVMTTETSYVSMKFNNSVNVVCSVIVSEEPQTPIFTFINNDGYFDGDENKVEIEYRSDELETNPIKIPVPYLTYGNGKFDLGWNDGTIDMLDVALQQKINEWSANPTDNVIIAVNAYEQADVGAYKDVSTNPTKTNYYEGERFNPAGLAFDAYDSSHAHNKTIKYDEVQYKRLFADTVFYLDSGKNLIDTDVMTLNTKYAAVYFNNCIFALSEVTVSEEPSGHSLVFLNDYGYFDGVESKTWVEYKSNSINNDAINIPVPYMDLGNGKFDYGWNDGAVDMLDVALRVKIDSWVKNPDTDLLIYVNAYDQADKNSYVNASKNPTKTLYHVGEKFNPSGLEFLAYDDGRVRTKTIKYDDVQYKRLFANITYLDSKKNPIDTDVMTLKTKYAAVYFNNCLYVVSPVTVSGKTTPYNPSDSDEGNSSSSPTVGPMGDLTKNPLYQQKFLQQVQINSTNNIPQNSLIANVELAMTLLSSSENANIPRSNVVDAYGNTGFGKWQKVPGTATWYFLAGDLNANGTLGTAGFVANGLYNLSWAGTNGWYSFSSTGVMQTGWQQINGRLYYFEPNSNDTNYGKASVGSRTINGQVYSFDHNGALAQ